MTTKLLAKSADFAGKSPVLSYSPSIIAKHQSHRLGFKVVRIVSRAHARICARARGLSSIPNLDKPGSPSLEFYANGVAMLVRPGAGNPCPKYHRREKITYLTAKSRNKMLATCQASGVHWQSMFVATYGNTFPKSGKIVKQNLDSLLQAFRRLGYKTYFWWLEFQERGAPHLHILLDLPPNNAHRVKVAKSWVNTLKSACGASGEELERVFAVHNHPNQWQPESKPGGLAHDVALYATKTRQKRVPKDFQDVGRWWGASRDVKPRKLGEMPLTSEQHARDILQAADHQTANWDILPKWIFGLGFDDLTA